MLPKLKIILTFSIIFISSLSLFAQDSAQSYLSQARLSIGQWQHYKRALSYNVNTTYLLYKEVYLNHRSLMTLKEIRQMYYLGLETDNENKDEDFLAEVKKTIEREQKVRNNQKTSSY